MWKEQHLYGSSRLGIFKPEINIKGTYVPDVVALQQGVRNYELTNHLGNVLSTITDKGVITSAQDYYPFGLTLASRSFTEGGSVYRFGFNGKENDKELKQQDYGFRLYRPDLGRWLSLDRLANKRPNYSPYAFSLNSPLMLNDPDGNDAVVTIIRNETGGGTITISATVYLTGSKANEATAQAMNKEAERVYKPGKYNEPGTEGATWDINIKVTYVYKEKIEKKDLTLGQNILDMSGTEIRSHTDAQIHDSPDGKTYHLTKNTGNIGNEKGASEADINKKTQWVILHETLHLLGLSDRYSDVKTPIYGKPDKKGVRHIEKIKIESVPDGDFKDDIMSKSGSEIISPFHYEMWGKLFSDKKTYPGNSKNMPLKIMVDRDPNTFKKNTPKKE